MCVKLLGARNFGYAIASSAAECTFGEMVPVKVRHIENGFSMDAMHTETPPGSAR